ncbi:MAG: hypothetical protein CVU00_14655 [Bacteroidetes bacterium HGW-Bacteroidetes-17]|jgi:hypothetical protein|nr:MAG: hypothetical protein CVU00_14655 [Bacteroidetes bacterium HGW-Bacteroidetes-17]
MEYTFQLDHVLIWVDKDAPEIGLFKENGFTSIISGTHSRQGTSAKYLFFLNFYIELLYISDHAEALENIHKFGCDYVKRSNWKHNRASPFGLALKMKPFKQENILFDYTEYEAVWMKDKSLIMAVNNKNLFDPLVFVLRPKMEFPCYLSMDEMLMDNKPDDFKKNHIHENGIKTLTSYIIYIKPEVQTSELINYLNASGINILNGAENCIELIFDHEINNREIDFRPRLPLVIKF